MKSTTDIRALQIRPVNGKPSPDCPTCKGTGVIRIKMRHFHSRTDRCPQCFPQEYISAPVHNHTSREANGTGAETLSSGVYLGDILADITRRFSKAN